jgi:hypothetical protein
VKPAADHGDQVRDHLQPGETFRAAVWASRADEHTAVDLSRAAMSPFRFRRRERGGWFQAEAGTLAAGLEEHIRIVTDPRILAATDRRLLVLSKRSGFPAGRPGLRPRWECPRASLASATAKDGRLTLTFADGSAVTLLTPAAEIQPFLDA